VTTVSPIDHKFEVRSICLCEQGSQPLSDSSPRPRINEDREVLSFGFACRDGCDGDRGMLLGVSQYGADVAVAEHFSQVMLCIWRL
jgi:hypothetical protein